MRNLNISGSITEQNVFPYYAVYLGFESLPLRSWTGREDRVFTDDFGSGSYIAVGDLGGITAIDETTEVAARGVNLSLNGIDPTLLFLAETDNYRNRPVAVYLLLMDTAGNVVDRCTTFKGRIDNMKITRGSETATITVSCENRLVDFNRAREIRYTNEYQRSIYPDDSGLEFIAAISNKDIWWGNDGPNKSPNAGVQIHGRFITQAN